MSEQSIIPKRRKRNFGTRTMQRLEKMQRLEEKKENIFYVAIETDEELDKTVSFSQFFYNNKVLITLIGEEHKLGHTHNCKTGKTKTVGQYCLDSVERNSLCKVLLEYSPELSDDQIKKIGSDNIREVFKKMKDKNYGSNIIPIDNRKKVLNEYQDWLYITHPQTFFSQIRERYIDSYFREKSNLIEDPEQKIDNSIKIFLQEYSQNHIETCFNEAKKMCNDLTVLLRNAWKDIVDYNIINTVLSTNTDTSEFIIIVGDAHYKNLYNIFNKLVSEKSEPNMKFLIERDIKNTKCIKLYNTYKFIS